MQKTEIWRINSWQCHHLWKCGYKVKSIITWTSVEGDAIINFKAFNWPKKKEFVRLLLLISRQFVSESIFQWPQHVHRHLCSVDFLFWWHLVRTRLYHVFSVTRYVFVRIIRIKFFFECVPGCVFCFTEQHYVSRFLISDTQNPKILGFQIIKKQK